MSSICEQVGCQSDSVGVYQWPGHDWRNICQEHREKAERLSRAMVCGPLSFRPEPQSCMQDGFSAFSEQALSWLEWLRCEGKLVKLAKCEQDGCSAMAECKISWPEGYWACADYCLRHGLYEDLRQRKDRGRAKVLSLATGELYHGHDEGCASIVTQELGPKGFPGISVGFAPACDCSKRDRLNAIEGEPHPSGDLKEREPILPQSLNCADCDQLNRELAKAAERCGMSEARFRDAVAVLFPLSASRDRLLCPICAYR